MHLQREWERWKETKMAGMQAWTDRHRRKTKQTCYRSSIKEHSRDVVCHEKITVICQMRNSQKTYQSNVAKFLVGTQLDNCCCNRWQLQNNGAVASNIRDPRFESRHRQNFITNILSVNCWDNSRKDENKQKRGPFLKITKHKPSYRSQ